MNRIDFVWTSDKEYASLIPLFKYMKKFNKSINVNIFKVKKFFFQNYQIKKNISDNIIISHDRPLKRLKKINWKGRYIYIEHGLSPMKFWTYKYKFFHDSSLLFYPGEVFERKMEKINPKFKNGLIGGYPKIDELVNQKSNREKFCKDHNLDFKKPIILFAPSYGSKKIKNTGINNAKYMKNINNLITIPHPADYNKAKQNGAILPGRKANINLYINNADIVISDVSSIVAEAAIVNKPTIQLILPIYPGCFPDKDKRNDKDSFINQDRINSEINQTDLINRPFKIPYLDEDWIFGYLSTPENIEKTIDLVLKNKNKYYKQREYWADQSCWKADGNSCRRISQMISHFIETGERKQIIE